MNRAAGEGQAWAGRPIPFRAQFATFATLTRCHLLLDTRLSATERGSCVTEQESLSLPRSSPAAGAIVKRTADELTRRVAAQARGLYDPAFEHDACGFGFVVDIAGRQSHDTVRDALTVLVNLEHRGATGSEKNTGDGAGITIQIPHGFLADVAARSGIRLRGKGGYGVGMVFLPQDQVSRVECFRLFEQVVADEGLHFLGWRDVPTDNTGLGTSAKNSQPLIRQVFIDRPERLVEDLAFERKLYVARRLVEKAVSRSAIPSRSDFYIPSLSCRTIVYKGMLNASQLLTFYPDLTDERVESAIAMVHSRFSTNTFPSWPRAHPYRYISHNGEINTLRGNVNWMHARQSQFSSSLFGDELTKALPAVDVEGSDSAILDNVLELLYLSGPLGGPFADDDGAGALAASRIDGSREAGLLRVPCLPDGALGRSRLDRVHRRHPRRRHARPQRPAARPLLRHQPTAGSSWPRKPGCWIFPPIASWPRGGSSRAGCSWSTRRSSGSSPTTS